MMSALIGFVRAFADEMEATAQQCDQLSSDGVPDVITSAGTLRMIAMCLTKACKKTLLG